MEDAMKNKSILLLILALMAGRFSNGCEQLMDWLSVNPNISSIIVTSIALYGLHKYFKATHLPRKFKAKEGAVEFRLPASRLGFEGPLANRCLNPPSIGTDESTALHIGKLDTPKPSIIFGTTCDVEDSE